MNQPELNNLLLSRPGVKLTLPFGPDTTVYKVGGKMFALFDIRDNPLRITLKSEPSNAIALREMFPAITPGYHMNKEHWITIVLDGSVPLEILYKMINDSYDLVYKSLSKVKQIDIESSAKG